MISCWNEWRATGDERQRRTYSIVRASKKQQQLPFLSRCFVLFRILYISSLGLFWISGRAACRACQAERSLFLFSFRKESLSLSLFYHLKTAVLAGFFFFLLSFLLFWLLRTRSWIYNRNATHNEQLVLLLRCYGSLWAPGSIRWPFRERRKRESGFVSPSCISKTTTTISLVLFKDWFIIDGIDHINGAALRSVSLNLNFTKIKTRCFYFWKKRKRKNSYHEMHKSNKWHAAESILLVTLFEIREFRLNELLLRRILCRL